MLKVFINPGHGGNDPGAVANGYKEKDINLAISLACRDELVRHGVIVMMSRETDARVGNAAAMCNAFKPDAAIDIHNNAGGGDGVEIFHHYKGGAGKVLAQNVIDSIITVGQNSRGLKTRRNALGKDYYAFIRETSAPAIIVECAFVDNKKDIAIVDTAAEQRAMGVAIAKGVLKTHGIAYKEAAEEEPKAEVPSAPAAVEKPPAAPAKPVVIAPKAGDVVKLEKGKLYHTARGGAYVTRTGTFYIYDGVKVGNRYRVTNKKESVGKSPVARNVSGWLEL